MKLTITTSKGKTFNLSDEVTTIPNPSNSIPLDHSKNWGYFPHDFQLKEMIGYSIWTDADKNRDGKTRWYPKQNGDPETVLTYFKDDVVFMSDAWQWFAFRQFVFMAFGHFDEKKLDPLDLDKLKKAWASAMQGNRVITNNRGWDDNYRDVILGVNLDSQNFGYMNLCMGGGVFVYKTKADGSPITVKPNAKFGVGYVIECLNGSNPPPDPRDVNPITTPHLVQIATVARYDKENTSGLLNRWSHVIPFPQMETQGYNSHVPLLNISNRDTTWVQTARAYIPKEKMTIKPNPYNPPLDKAFA